jgi:hypothetical protein
MKVERGWRIEMATEQKQWFKRQEKGHAGGEVGTGTDFTQGGLLNTILTTKGQTLFIATITCDRVREN